MTNPYNTGDRVTRNRSSRRGPSSEVREVRDTCWGIVGTGGNENLSWFKWCPHK